MEVVSVWTYVHFPKHAAKFDLHRPLNSLTNTLTPNPANATACPHSSNLDNVKQMGKLYWCVRLLNWLPTLLRSSPFIFLQIVVFHSSPYLNKKQQILHFLIMNLHVHVLLYGLGTLGILLTFLFEPLSPTTGYFALWWWWNIFQHRESLKPVSFFLTLTDTFFVSYLKMWSG